MGAFLRFRRMLSRILAVITVLIMPPFSPAFGQGSQLDGDVLSVRVHNESTGSKTLQFIVADRRAVSQAELNRIEEIIIREAYRIPWGTIPHLPYYVECPAGIGWTPCAPYEETIYLSCVVEAQSSSPTGRASFEAQELCLRRATNPSLADRLRYR